MLHKTRGIVFKVTSYLETSVVVQIFTEKFGLQPYLINGVKKPRAKIRLNMLQPLHLVELVVYHKPNGGIQRVSELRNVPVFQTIPYNVLKSSLVLFLNEVLYKSIKQHFEDEPLFHFLFNSIQLLDRTEKGLANFHLSFLLQLSRYIGFYPDRTNEADALYFDLVNGCFTLKLPDHALTIRESELKYFKDLLRARFTGLEEMHLSTQDRRLLLENILKYYELHIENFSNVKSHHVLEVVLG
ncbi:DNA repair protein RecO [Desertivirga xinjiangensis]|uniref:DNA repair protein RecO n=1 Tax=Desertivirga xinjiangensis TaxID=539206 RepID=UPI00210A394A|nr:DNA repair protein RecO [Pedobacter xinjiangensis]